MSVKYSMFRLALTVVVEVLDEVSLAFELSSELSGVHVGEGSLLRCDSLWINHFFNGLIFEIIIGRYFKLMY